MNAQIKIKETAISTELLNDIRDQGGVLDDGFDRTSEIHYLDEHDNSLILLIKNPRPRYDPNGRLNIEGTNPTSGGKINLDLDWKWKDYEKQVVHFGGVIHGEC